MNGKNPPNPLFLLIVGTILFGGLAITLYAIGLSELAVIPTIGAVSAAAIAGVRAVSRPGSGSETPPSSIPPAPAPATISDTTTGNGGNGVRGAA